jgi:hypothetical protein
LGQSILVVLCAGSTLLLATKLRTRHFVGASTSFLVPLPKSTSNNFRKWFLSPTGRLNFGFITEGKLTAVLITPSSWGSQLVVNTTHQQVFWRRCRGERGFLQGESLTSNLFTLLLFCLVSLLYFCLHLFIKIQKNSSFYSWYVVTLFLFHYVDP